MVTGRDGACGGVRRRRAHGQHGVPGGGRRPRARAGRRHRPPPRGPRPAPRHRRRRSRPAHRPRPRRAARRRRRGGRRLHGARRVAPQPGVGGRARRPRRGRHHRVHRRRPRALRARFTRSNCLDRPQLRHRRRADDAVRRAGGAVVRDGRGHRAAPRPQGRRPVGHGHARRSSAWPRRPTSGATTPPRRRCSTAPGGRPARPASTCTRCACAAWSPTRRCCSAPRASR